MRRLAISLLMVGALATSAGAGVHVGVHIGIPAPPAIVLPAPPRLVVVPGVPTVQYAPDLGVDFFFYGGSYYTHHRGAWFIAPTYGGPWTYVERVHVPHPLLAVPYRYYRVAPRYGWGRGHYGHHHHYYYRSRTGGHRAFHGHPHGMPPGQAKKLYGGR